MSERTWLLGGDDSEMSAIESVLWAEGEQVAYAINASGSRVRPFEAYRAAAPATVAGVLYLVECGGDWEGDHEVVRIDHHRPGDHGFGRGPEEYWGASSLGQVCSILGVAPTSRFRLIAAADHCLAAAYAGQCPGVSPAELVSYRDSSRAVYLETLPPSRPEVRAITDAALESDQCLTTTVRRVRNRTRRAIRSAPKVRLGEKWVADLRPGTLPELPEASAREGIAAVYQLTTPKGVKLGIMGAGEGTLPGTEPVEEFLRMAREGEVLGTKVDANSAYGDPVRGYAGVMVAE